MRHTAEQLVEWTREDLIDAVQTLESDVRDLRRRLQGADQRMLCRTLKREIEEQHKQLKDAYGQIENLDLGEMCK